MAASHNFRSRFTRSVVVSICVVLLLAEALLACTSFCLRDGNNFVLAKNRDLHLDDGLVIVNKRNVAKRALLPDATDKPARWVSKYGSVTFTGIARELPEGGMNEAGLVLEVMWLFGTRYPAPDNREAVMAWVQYQLDNYGTIKEVIESDQTVRVAAGTPMPLHFLGCDHQGNVATFEFLDGKLVCHTGHTLPITALANDTYDKSLAHLKQHTGFGGTKQIPFGSWGSLDRFVCAAEAVKKYRSGAGKPVIEYAFDTLAGVRQGDGTKWTIVYDLKKMEIHYKTVRYPKVKTIRLRDCDFDCRTPVQVISINTAHAGLLNPHFHHYETDLSRWLVYYSFRHTDFLFQGIPDEALEVLAEYGDAPAMYYLMGWEVAGPYMQKDKNWTELFDISFDPELPSTKVAWRTIPFKQSGHPAYLDLHEALNGGDQRVAYLRTQIKCDEDKLACLEMYSDDGVKAWLNRKLIHANNVSRALPVRPDMVDVTLKQGNNHLMLKVTQDVGQWGAIVRLRPVEGAKPTHEK
jgi:penicillin V acylase-like amidase (Ntn superfamily)